MEDLPLYDITIDENYSDGEDLGIEMIAFTSKPAVKVKGMAFNSNEKQFFADQVKMRIVAPAMIPMDIYRNDDGNEYMVRFTESEIDKIHSKLMSNLTNKNLFNLEHNSDEVVPAYILEAWIVEDPKTDKAKTVYGIDVVKGTLMLTTQITDEQYYNDLVQSGQVGYSIEGYLGMKMEQFKIDTNMKLPDGEHLIEDKIYVVKGGEVIEIKDVPTEEVVEEEMATEVVEEEVEATEETEVVEEEMSEPKKEEMAVDPTTDAEAVMAIVQPMIDEKVNELLQVIAEVKALMEAKPEEVEDVELSEVKLTAIDRFKKFIESNK